MGSSLRNAGYLDYVRDQPCCSCGAPAPSDPHHWGTRGMGIKADDYCTLPLCRGCHNTWHQHQHVGHLGRTETERLFLRVQRDLLVGYLRQYVD